MGIRNLKQAITETIKAACRPPWASLNKKRYRPGQLPGSRSSITITHTITQTTSEATTPDMALLKNSAHAFARRGRAWSPSLLTINSEVEFSPEGSPPGVALGIPPEHILDEDPSPMDAPIPLDFHRKPTSDTLPTADDGTAKRLRTFDGGSSIASVYSPSSHAVEVDGPLYDDSPRPTWATHEASGVRTAVRNEQGRMVESATLPLQGRQTSLINDLLFFSLPNQASEHLATSSSLPSAQYPSFSYLYEGKGATDPDSDSCTLCAMSDRHYKCYQSSNHVFQERRAFLPCGHCFERRYLYSWMFSAFCNRQPLRCPRGCISLFHKCGHPTMPVWQPPIRLHWDPRTAIPWNYDFCESEHGKACIGIISRLVKAERATAPRSMQPEGEKGGKRGLRGRLRDTLVSPLSRKMHQMVKFRRQQAMRYWKKSQINWWLDRWEDTSGIEPKGKPFW